LPPDDGTGKYSFTKKALAGSMAERKGVEEQRGEVEGYWERGRRKGQEREKGKTKREYKRDRNRERERRNAREKGDGRHKRV